MKRRTVIGVLVPDFLNVENLAILAMAVMMCTATFAQNDSLSMDTTLWYNQTQQLHGVVVKGRLPKTRAKGDAMRTTVAGTILEKAGTLSDALSKYRGSGAGEKQKTRM